jgi:hypothetical protein
MDHRWPGGGRIGVRVRAGIVTAALVVDGRLEGQSTVRVTGTGDRAITALLRDLGSRAAVESVAWELSDLLTPTASSAPVAALRIAPRRPVSPALGRHPAPLVRSLVGREAVVRGGHDLFGTELTPLDVDAAVREARAAREAGFEALAVTATGAVGSAEHETAVAERILDAVPGLRLSLSHEIGGFGLLQREAATVFNAALRPLAAELVDRCERITAGALPRATAWFATGDGVRLSAERTRTFPVALLGAHGAAALLGAAMLAAAPTARVILADNSTLVSGHVRDGFPHAAADVMESAGVRLATPQAVLSPLSAAVPAAGPEATVIAAVDQAGADTARELAGRLKGSILVDPGSDLVAVGGAGTEPGAWLDTVVSADSPAELQRVRALLEQRACTMLASGGARPGSERVVSSAVLPMSFLSSGSYRIVIRASGRSGAEG